MTVHLSDGFILQVRAHFPTERGSEGEPSAEDFMTFVIRDAVVEHIDLRYDDLAELPSGIRVFHGHSHLGCGTIFAISCFRHLDNWIELLSIVFDDDLDLLI